MEFSGGSPTACSLPAQQALSPRSEAFRSLLEIAIRIFLNHDIPWLFAKMKIRDYEPEDYGEILELSYRIWEPVFDKMEKMSNPEIYEVLVPDWKAEQKRSVDSVTGSEDAQVIVACEAGRIVGFAAIKSHPDDFLGEIHMIGVDPDFQAQGIGSELTEAGLQIIKRNGFKLAMVETGGDPAHESARKTYQKMGFELWPVARYFKRI